MGEERLEVSMAQPFSACREAQLLERERHKFGMCARPQQQHQAYCHNAIRTVLMDRASLAAQRNAPGTVASAWG